MKNTQKLMDEIKDILHQYKVETLTSYELEKRHYLITEFMILSYSEKNKYLDLSFHVSTRADIAASFVLILNNIEVLKDKINIMEIYMEDCGSHLTGMECIERNQEIKKNIIINDFMNEQIQTHYLKNSDCGEAC